MMLVVIVVLPHWRFFVSGLLFYANGTPPWLLKPVKNFPSSELSSTLTTLGCLLLPGFSVTSLSHFIVSAMVLSEHILPTSVFYLAPLLYILAIL